MSDGAPGHVVVMVQRLGLLSPIAAGCLILLVVAFGAVGGVGASGAPLSLAPVPVESGRATIAGREVELIGPDEPDAPTLWEGPIRVVDRTSGRRCTIAVELIAHLFADEAGRALLVVSRSGSTTYLDLYHLASCQRAAPTEVVITEGVQAASGRIEILPSCECAPPADVCVCNAGRVLQVDADLRMRRLAVASRRLTREHLGVAFTGEAQVADPSSARARIVRE